jgi:hypothetical protein
VIIKCTARERDAQDAFPLSLVPAIEVSSCGSKTVNNICKRDGEYKGTPKFSRDGNGFIEPIPA